MFLKLLSIEWVRLSRRPLMWITLAGGALYTGLSLSNFYKINRIELLEGTLAMPGVAFDLANSLDQLLIAIPFLVILAGVLMGSDYSQRTNRLWLTRASRTSSLLAKFTLLVSLTLVIQILTLVTGGLVGHCYKTLVYHTANVFNVNWLALVAAPLYMTLVNLPYIALALALTVAFRSTFFSVVLGLGYTQILEYLLTGIFFGAGWTKWLLTNVYFSVSFLLNSIGNKVVEAPVRVLASTPALVISAAYTLLLLILAVWLYRRQDVGGDFA
jgi:hypothetical protein